MMAVAPPTCLAISARIRCSSQIVPMTATLYDKRSPNEARGPTSNPCRTVLMCPRSVASSIDTEISSSASSAS